MSICRKNYYLTLFFILSIVFIMSNVIINLHTEKDSYQITVEQGDSLWELAEKFGSDKPREIWINQVMEINNLHSSLIKTGDILIIPSEFEPLYLEHSKEIAGES